MFNDSLDNLTVTCYSRFFKTILIVMNMHNYAQHGPL